MPEVVRPVDGDPVTLRPCPSWCTRGRHFADGMVVHADDGYHHTGDETEVPTSSPFLGMTDGAPTIVRAVLKSWTHPLGAAPGPALIELSLGTAAERTDLCAEASPRPRPRPRPSPGRSWASRRPPAAKAPQPPAAQAPEAPDAGHRECLRP